MAVKHIKEAFDQIASQYSEMLDEIRDFEEEASKGLIEPERLDQIKESIKPLMANYERWSYIMFLLNKPVKKTKEKKYLSQNKKFIASLNKNNSIESSIEENKQVIKDLKKLTKENKNENSCRRTK